VYVIDLIDMDSGQLVNTVDSNTCKLRRPAGMVAFTECQNSANDENHLPQRLLYYALVTDVAADSLNKYRFF